MIHLGVNIDHVATVRQARQAMEPDPVFAAQLAELGGAHGITVHLRQDRRHIQDRDVRLLRETVHGILNLEMGVGEELLDLALAILPDQACLVPGHRQEITTENGLLVDPDDRILIRTITRLRESGVLVSLFIEPDVKTVRNAQQIGADAVELHTGSWANAFAQCQGDEHDEELQHQDRRLRQAAEAASECKLRLHAGHGITYANVRHLLHLPALRELNIGHSIVSRALMVGMQRAVQDMCTLIAAGPCRPTS